MPNLTPIGTPLYVPAQIGNGLNPNGGRLETTTPTGSSETSFTIQAILDSTGGTGTRIAFDGGTSGNRIQLGISSAGKPLFRVGTLTYDYSPTVLAAGPHHFAINFGANRVRFYLDGVQLNTATGLSAVLNLSTGYNLGQSISGSSQWVGTIDEVVISKGELYPGGTTFTPPTSYAVDANTVALHHLEADGTDSAIVIVPPVDPEPAESISASQTIYADNVPSDSGLTNVIANDMADDSATLQAQLDYIKATWGAGTLVLPAGKTMRLSAAGLVVPKKVRIVGHPSSVLRYMPTSGNAIKINDELQSPLERFKIQGPGSGDQGGMTGMGTSVGLNIKGYQLNFKELEIAGFYRGIDTVNNDTYILAFDKFRLHNNRYCVWADIDNKSGLNAAAASNSGERFMLTDSLVYNSPQAFYYSANGAGLFIKGCSVDYCAKYGTFWNNYTHITSSHLETHAGTLNSPDGGGYMFEQRENAKTFLTDTDIIIGGESGIGRIVDPSSAPYNYGVGYFKALHCSAYFRNNVGRTNNVGSEHTIVVNSGASSYTGYSPWSPRWGHTKAEFMFQDGFSAPAGITATLTSFNATTGQYVVTFSGAIPNTALLRIDFNC